MAVQLHALAALLTRKVPMVPIKYKAEWAKQPVWML